jgi:hypothetical protein
MNPHHSDKSSFSSAFSEPTVSDKHTFYVLIRTDIPLHQQVVQSVHAAAEAARTYYRREHGIASAVVLSVPDKASLLAAQAKLHAKGIATDLFFEPDFGIGESALATQPLRDEQRKHLRTWPLWRAVDEKALVAA